MVSRAGLHRGAPEKGVNRRAAEYWRRNNRGRVTSRGRGGRSKRSYRIIDFLRRSRMGQEASVVRIEYDPNRSAFIALIEYKDGERSYILAPQK